MNTTFTTINGTTFTANETMTHCYCWPKGRKGERVRIKKAEFEAAQRENELERKAAELDAAAENPEVTLEQFVELVQDAGESADTEAGEEAVERVEAPVELQPAILNEHGLVDCRECPIRRECIHYDCMRRNPSAVGGLDLCPRLAIKAPEAETPKAPKAKRTRKVKDAQEIRVGDTTVVLTSKQVDFIRHLPDTNFWENGLDSTPWTDVLCDEIGGQFAGKPMTTGAMISTLCEKGLAYRGKDKINKRTCTYMGLTELGKLVAAELGLH